MSLHRVAVIALLSLLWSGFCVARTIIPLNDHWQFKEAAVDNASAAKFDTAGWDAVTIPHMCPPVGKADRLTPYWGEAWYRRAIDAAAEWKGKRVFLRFEAAAMTSDTYLNGEHLGQHRGGFSAFVYEITDKLKLGATNSLAVRVDDRWNDDVSPLEKSLLYAGIYRPVSLIVTDPVSIDLLDFGSPGVFATQRDVSAAAATVDVKTNVNNGSATASAVSVKLTLLDADQKVVLTQTTAANAPARATSAVTQSFKFDQPHLWNGQKDPYLYAVRVELLDGSKVIDSVTQPLGLRFFHFDATQGFSLNGKPYPIHGACLHQDFGTAGWAVTPAQEQQDLTILTEMGCTALRLVHYPHSQSALDLYDQAGIICWAELAQFRLVGKSPAYANNVRDQLIEMIRQNYNHPSILMWSLYNELASSVNATAEPIVKDLNALAHKEDPTRPTIAAGSGDTIYNSRAISATPDLIGDNNYPGWYFGAPEDMNGEIEKINNLYQKRGLCISEYGGGAKIGDHAQNVIAGQIKPRESFQPEEWQALVHEGNYRAIKNHPEVWGCFIWLAFDSGGLPKPNGAIDGGNIKGMVTQDRATRKDAYYLYQANWSDKPMIYLTSKRHVNRTEATTPVKVYSNASSVTLIVNGKDYGPQTPDDLHVFLWRSVPLKSGENRIKVVTGDGLSDEAAWTLK